MIVSAGSADDITTVSQAGRSPSGVEKTMRVAVSCAESAPAAALPRVRDRASAGVVMVGGRVTGAAAGDAVLTGAPPRVSRCPALFTDAVSALCATVWPAIRW